MNIILLAGGSGKRLWPLSNEVRSKQFLKILTKEDGTRESMVQRVYRMIKEVDPEATITIATSQSQIPQIKSQLGDNVGISIEPTRRDTFPAIALAAAYLKENGVNAVEPVVVCPVDPYVNIDYFECIKKMSNEAGKTNLTLMGREPTYPSEKYGYIIPTSSDPITFVKEFKEKPDEKTETDRHAGDAQAGTGSVLPTEDRRDDQPREVRRGPDPLGQGRRQRHSAASVPAGDGADRRRRHAGLVRGRARLHVS